MILISPNPEQVLEARKRAGLTQAQAAELVGFTVYAWRKWERPCSDPNHRKMRPVIWDLFRSRAGV